ncbi:MAG: VIT family protein [Propionibacteriaceae bacterium]|jgi:VIT1/CCC1 family predicted Fe2+/Mn2+ transporter|nr:VIT family protein [Propionibacteriaceae bacterium]
MSVSTAPAAGQARAPAPARLANKLNWLRAGVLGSNDGIVSTAGIVMGVAGATADSNTLLIAGLAGLVAGALSMAGGEYVSVSSQRDTELAAVAEVQSTLCESPDMALAALAQAYRDKGLEPDLADRVAQALTDHDAVSAQVEAHLGISADQPTSPWQAARASLLAFVIGALVPLSAMVMAPPASRVWCTMAAVVVALVLTGAVSARLGRASVVVGIARNVAVGLLTMGLTYGIGHLIGVGL